MSRPIGVAKNGNDIASVNKIVVDSDKFKEKTSQLQIPV